MQRNALNMYEAGTSHYSQKLYTFITQNTHFPDDARRGTSANGLNRSLSGRGAPL